MSQNSNLGQMLEQMNELEKVASLVADDYSVRNRAGGQMAIGNAKNAIQSIKKTYGEALLNTTTVLTLSGTQASIDKFLETYTSKLNLPVFNINSFYDNIAQPVYKVVQANHNTLNIDQYLTLLFLFSEAMNAAGYDEVKPLPSFSSSVVFNAYEPFLNYFKEAVLSTNGNEPSLSYFKSQVVSYALNNKVASDKFYIVVPNVNKDEFLALEKSFGNVKELNVSKKKVDEETLLGILEG